MTVRLLSILLGIVAIVCCVIYILPDPTGHLAVVGIAFFMTANVIRWIGE